MASQQEEWTYVIPCVYRPGVAGGKQGSCGPTPRFHPAVGQVAPWVVPGEGGALLAPSKAGYRAGSLGGRVGCRPPHPIPEPGWEPAVSREGKRGCSVGSPLFLGQPRRKDGFEVGRHVSSGSQQPSLCVWTLLTRLLAPSTSFFFFSFFFVFCGRVTSSCVWS